MSNVILQDHAILRRNISKYGENGIYIVLASTAQQMKFSIKGFLSK